VLLGFEKKLTSPADKEECEATEILASFWFYLALPKQQGYSNTHRICKKTPRIAKQAGCLGFSLYVDMEVCFY